MSQQGLLQASIRAITGTQETFEGDWHALFDLDGIPAGQFDGRLLRWINAQLGRTYTNLPEAQQAYAATRGAYNWSSLDSVLWSPLLLGASLAAWWDASQGVTSAATLVSAWEDRVGGHSIAQSSGTLKPVYSATSYGGAPGLTFDGSDDYMELAGVPDAFPTGAETGWVFGAVSQDLPGTTATIRVLGGYGGSAANGQRSLRRTPVSNVNRATVSDGSNARVDATVDFSGVGALFGFYNATSMVGRINGTDMLSFATVPATATDRVRFGSTASLAAGNYWGGVVAHFIVGIGTLSTANKERLEAWALWQAGAQAKLPANHPYRNRRP